MFRRGDIAELCDLVHPKIGVITAIGPMHLERLGSIEAIAAAKGELLDALPPDGHFITNAKDPRCLELAARAKVPVTLFGVEHDDSTDRPPPPWRPKRPARRPARPIPSLQNNNPPAHIVARNVRLSDGRTTFTLLLDGPDSPQVEVSAGLLGAHNVSNLLAAAAVGRVLGIPLERIARGTRPGAGAGAPAAADPQPPRRGGRDRRRLQLQPRRSRRRAGGAARAPRHPAPARDAGDGRAGRARGAAQPSLRRAGGRGLRHRDPGRPRPHRADPRRARKRRPGRRQHPRGARHRRGDRACSGASRARATWSCSRTTCPTPTPA